jgi:hypothetical protein
MAAAVAADAGDLPRAADFLVSFFAVTISKTKFQNNFRQYAGSIRARECNKEIRMRHKNLQKFRPEDHPFSMQA